MERIGIWTLEIPGLLIVGWIVAMHILILRQAISVSGHMTAQEKEETLLIGGKRVPEGIYADIQ